MRRKIAEAHNPVYICPLCEYLDADEQGIIDHLVEKHEDNDAWWNE